MSHAKDIYDRTKQAYKEGFDFCFRERSDDLGVTEMLVVADFLKRDFSKRQQRILIFIHHFSYPFGKSSAIFPNVKDFNLCGVDQKKIREELDKLVAMNVIEINHAASEYSIKDPREWEADYQSGYDDKRSQELIKINLEHAGVDIKNCKRPDI